MDPEEEATENEETEESPPEEGEGEGSSEGAEGAEQESAAEQESTAEQGGVEAGDLSGGEEEVAPPPAEGAEDEDDDIDIPPPPPSGPKKPPKKKNDDDFDDADPFAFDDSEVANEDEDEEEDDEEEEEEEEEEESDDEELLPPPEADCIKANFTMDAPGMAEKVRRIINQSLSTAIHLGDHSPEKQVVIERIMRDLEEQWKTTGSPTKIIPLLQELCNIIVELGRGHVGEAGALGKDPEDGQALTRQVVKAIDAFQALIDFHKEQLPDPETQKYWDFLLHIEMKQFNKFSKRIRKLQDVFESCLDFIKLEKIDIGGNKGKFLTSRMQACYADFQDFLPKWSASVEYDPTDPDDDSFLNETIFKDKETDVDQRIISIISLGLEDCHTPESIYKLIFATGTLLNRPQIKASIEPLYPKYAAALQANLDSIREQYNKSVVPFKVTERALLNPGLPPYTSSIYWGREMRERISEESERFKELGLPIDEEETENIDKRGEELTTTLEKFERKTYAEWRKFVETDGKKWLDQIIMSKNKGDKTLLVNFPPEMQATMKEVKYMEAAGFTEIPGVAQKLSVEQPLYGKNLEALDQVAQSYNKILETSIPEEEGLLATKMQAIDQSLEQGLKDMKWGDPLPNIFEYAVQVKEPVVDLENRLQDSKANVEAVKELVVVCIDKILFERKEGKKENLLEIEEDSEIRKEQQYKELTEMSTKLWEILDKNQELIKVPDKKGAEAWTAYLKYMDEFVLDAMTKTTTVSLQYLLDQTNSQKTPSPLFQIVVDLVEGEVVYDHPLDPNAENSLASQFKAVLTDIFHQGKLVKRVKEDSGENYYAELQKASEIADMRKELLDRLRSVIKQGTDFMAKFEKYDWLYLDSREDYLSQFLKYGHELTAEELDMLAGGEEVKEQHPTLDQFKEAIEKFEKLYSDVEMIPKEYLFDKWVRIDLNPFRDNLLAVCKEWNLMFKRYLNDSVVGWLAELEVFVKEADAGLKQILQIVTYAKKMKEK